MLRQVHSAANPSDSRLGQKGDEARGKKVQPKSVREARFKNRIETIFPRAVSVNTAAGELKRQGASCREVRITPSQKVERTYGVTCHCQRDEGGVAESFQERVNKIRPFLLGNKTHP